MRSKTMQIYIYQITFMHKNGDKADHQLFKKMQQTLLIVDRLIEIIKF